MKIRKRNILGLNLPVLSHKIYNLHFLLCMCVRGGMRVIYADVCEYMPMNVHWPQGCFQYSSLASSVLFASGRVFYIFYIADSQ